MFASSPARVAPQQLHRPMESILEESSELATEIAQAVVAEMDIDRKIDERAQELMLRGDRIFRDIKTKQEQSCDMLNRAVAQCVKSQSSLRDEHAELLKIVRELAMSCAPFVGNSRDNIWDSRYHASISALPGSIKTTGRYRHRFSITLRKADDVSLGLCIQADQAGKVLVVQNVVPGGAVESWNRQCFNESCLVDHIVVPGDHLIIVNGVEGDAQQMLKQCTQKRLVKLAVGRGLVQPEEPLQQPQVASSSEGVPPLVPPLCTPTTPSSKRAPPDESPQKIFEQASMVPRMSMASHWLETGATLKPRLLENSAVASEDDIDVFGKRTLTYPRNEKVNEFDKEN